jgi:hypothetical protein
VRNDVFGVVQEGYLIVIRAQQQDLAVELGESLEQ